MLYHNIQYLHSTILCNLAAMLALCELGTQPQTYNFVFHVGIQLYNVFFREGDEASCFKTEMEEW